MNARWVPIRLISAPTSLLATAKMFQLACVVCCENFSDAASLARHVGSSHVREMCALYVCRRCFCVFDTPSLLSQHESGMCQRSMEPPVYSCKGCDKRFHTQRGLQAHTRTHILPRHACGACSETFRTKTALMRHAKVHKRGKFECQNCDRQFATPRALALHAKVHTKPRIKKKSPAPPATRTQEMVFYKPRENEEQHVVEGMYFYCSPI